MNEKVNWETVLSRGNGMPDWMARAKVPGGWLVRTESGIDDNHGIGHGVGLCFYPDPTHGWEPELQK